MAEAAKSWWAKAILIGSILGAVLLPVGALGTRFGIWGFQTGLLAVGAGTILAVIGMFVGIIALFVSSKRGYTSDRPSILLGVMVSVLVLATMGMQFYTASSVPPIHDITTDVNDPPEFDVVVALRADAPNSLEYEPEAGEMQLTAYPSVKTLSLDVSRAEALDRAINAMEAMGMEVQNKDEVAGIVEGTATTFWFGFKDDVVVRVRDSGSGSVVDVRSVSRVGVSDLGTNAKRIVELLSRLTAG